MVGATKILLSIVCCNKLEDESDLSLSILLFLQILKGVLITNYFKINSTL